MGSAGKCQERGCSKYELFHFHILLWVPLSEDCDGYRYAKQQAADYEQPDDEVEPLIRRGCLSHDRTRRHWDVPSEISCLSEAASAVFARHCSHWHGAVAGSASLAVETGDQ